MHDAQCLNYLKTTGLKLCWLLKFANLRPLFKRLLHDFLPGSTRVG
jgi:hypothetical protein